MAPVARAQAVEIQAPVQVVEFVLQAPCEMPGSLDLDQLSGEVSADDDDVLGAGNRQVKAGDGKAALGAVLVTVAADEPGVDQIALVAVDVVAEDAQAHADLRRGEPGPAGQPAGVQQVGHEPGEGGVKPGHGLGRLTEHGVAELADGPDGHGSAWRVLP
jgi:hypothetical protein